MTDFVQTMKDWRRMCAEISCPDCEIFDYCEGLPSADIDKIQRIVTAWAAEHPEPVYLTWMEWLTDVGAIPKVISWDEPLVEAVYDALQKHISADIAEKLGIEPKEG